MCLSTTSSKCCFRPSLAEPTVSSFLQPSGVPRYQCGPAHWHSTISKTVACLPKPHRNLTSRPDTREGGVNIATHKKTANTSLSMQWLLWNKGCQLDAYTLQNPMTLRHPEHRLMRCGKCRLSDSASNTYRPESSGEKKLPPTVSVKCCGWFWCCSWW